MDVHFRLPVPSSTLVTNLLGLFGLAAVVIAVGLLAGFAWGLLGAGVIAVGLSALAQNAARPAQATAAGAPPLKAVA